MKPFAVASSILCVAVALLGCAASPPKVDAPANQADAKVSRPDAEKAALGKVPNGTVKAGELENERGRLVWSFDIATPDTTDITEVQIDARTGEVVAVEKETAAQQDQEKREDAR